MDAQPLKDFNLIMTTENPAKKMKFQWSIRNINKLPGTIRTSKFSLARGQPCVWDVSIRQETGDTFQFCLAYHAQRDAVPILVRSCSRILKNNGSLLEHSYQSTHLYNGGDQHPLFSRVKFTDQEGDKIVLQCSMTVHGYGLVSSRNLCKGGDQEDIAKLKRDYWMMTATCEEFADLEISVADLCFPAHRCVLKYLAPKFFSEHLHAIMEGKLRLTGIDPDLFELILMGIYSGEFNPTAIILDVEPFYCAASRYDLRTLLRKSIQDIVYNMRTDNVCKFYRMADSRRDEKLVQYCEAFIKDNLQELKANADYAKLCSSIPHLPRINTYENGDTIILH